MCALVAALLLAGPACSDDAAPQSQTYKRAVALEEHALALLRHGESVVVTLPTELVRLDPGVSSPVRLADGRYRECPGDPSRKWGESMNDEFGSPQQPAPRVTPRGDYIVFSSGECSWAWPLAGGNVIQLARALTPYGPDTPPSLRWEWSAFSDKALRVVSDGEGWLAWGLRSIEGRGMWRFDPDGTPREEFLRLDDVEPPSRMKVLEVHAEPDGVYLLLEPNDRSVRRSVLGRIERATKTWTELYTWKRAPGESTSRPPASLVSVLPSSFIINDGDGLVLMSKNGGAPQTITACSACLSATADASHVYWWLEFEGQLWLRSVPHSSPGGIEELLTIPALSSDSIRADYIRKRGLVPTRDSVWFATLEGPDPKQWKPWLSNVRRP